MKNNILLKGLSFVLCAMMTFSVVPTAFAAQEPASAVPKGTVFEQFDSAPLTPEVKAIEKLAEGEAYTVETPKEVMALAAKLKSAYSFDPTLKHVVPKIGVTPPYAFISCSTSYDTYKIDITTGNVVAVYAAYSDNTLGYPRRIGYDHFGNTWVCQVGTSGGSLQRIAKDVSAFTPGTQTSNGTKLPYDQEQATITFSMASLDPTGQLNDPRFVVFDSKGFMWVGASSTPYIGKFSVGNNRTAPKLVQKYNVKTLGATTYSSTYVGVIDQNDDIYISSQGAKVSLGDGTNPTASILPISGGSTYGVTVDAYTGNVWWTSAGSKASVYNPADGTMKYYTYPGGFAGGIGPVEADEKYVYYTDGYSGANGNAIYRFNKITETWDSSFPLEPMADGKKASCHGIFALKNTLILVMTHNNSLRLIDKVTGKRIKDVAIGTTPYVYGAFVTSERTPSARVSGKALFAQDGIFNDFANQTDNLASSNKYELFKLVDTTLATGQKLFDVTIDDSTGLMNFKSAEFPAGVNYINLNEGNYVIKQTANTRGRNAVAAGVVEGSYQNEMTAAHELKFSVKDRQNIRLYFGASGSGNKITGNIWMDANKDGKKDVSEQPYKLGLVTIKLDLVNLSRINNGQTTATAKPDANGNYEFTNIENGNYTIEVVNSSLGANKITTGPGTDNKFVSATSQGPAIAVAGKDVTKIDLGLLQTGVNISGIVFKDANDDGNKAGDSGHAVADFDLELYNGATKVDAVKNAVGGAYSFKDVQAGTYTILAKYPKTQYVISSKLGDNKFERATSKTQAAIVVASTTISNQDVGIVDASAPVITGTYNPAAPTWVNKSVTLTYKGDTLPEFKTLTLKYNTYDAAGVPTAVVQNDPKFVGKKSETNTFVFATNNKLDIEGENNVDLKAAAKFEVTWVDKVVPTIVTNIPKDSEADATLFSKVVFSDSNTSPAGVASNESKINAASKVLYLYDTTTGKLKYTIAWSNIATKLSSIAKNDPNKYYFVVGVRDIATNHTNTLGQSWNGTDGKNPDKNTPGPDTDGGTDVGPPEIQVPGGPKPTDPTAPSVDPDDIINVGSAPPVITVANDTIWANKDYKPALNVTSSFAMTSINIAGTAQSITNNKVFNKNLAYTSNEIVDIDATNTAKAGSNSATKKLTVSKIDKVIPKITIALSANDKLELTAAALNDGTKVVFEDFNTSVAPTPANMSGINNAKKALHLYDAETGTLKYTIAFSSLATKLPNVTPGEYAYVISVRDVATNYYDTYGRTWDGKTGTNPGENTGSETDKEKGTDKGPDQIKVPAPEEIVNIGSAKPTISISNDTLWTNKSFKTELSVTSAFKLIEVKVGDDIKASFTGKKGTTKQDVIFDSNVIATASAVNGAKAPNNSAEKVVTISKIDKVAPTVVSKIAQSSDVSASDFTDTTKVVFDDANTSVAPVPANKSDIDNATKTLYLYEKSGKPKYTIAWANISAKLPQIAQNDPGVYYYVISTRDNATNYGNSIGGSWNGKDGQNPDKNPTPSVDPNTDPGTDKGPEVNVPGETKPNPTDPTIPPTQEIIIGSAAPVITQSHDTVWTKENIQATYNVDGKLVLKEVVADNNKVLQAVGLKNYTDKILFTDNGSKVVSAKNSGVAGKNSATETIVVDNIDKIAPIIELEVNGEQLLIKSTTTDPDNNALLTRPVGARNSAIKEDSFEFTAVGGTQTVYGKGATRQDALSKLLSEMSSGRVYLITGKVLDNASNVGTTPSAVSYTKRGTGGGGGGGVGDNGSLVITVSGELSDLKAITIRGNGSPFTVTTSLDGGSPVTLAQSVTTLDEKVIVPAGKTMVVSYSYDSVPPGNEMKKTIHNADSIPGPELIVTNNTFASSMTYAAFGQANVKIAISGGKPPYTKQFINATTGAVIPQVLLNRAPKPEFRIKISDGAGNVMWVGSDKADPSESGVATIKIS